MKLLIIQGIILLFRIGCRLLWNDSNDNQVSDIFAAKLWWSTLSLKLAWEIVPCRLLSRWCRICTWGRRPPPSLTWKYLNIILNIIRVMRSHESTECLACTERRRGDHLCTGRCWWGDPFPRGTPARYCKGWSHKNNVKYSKGRVLGILEEFVVVLSDSNWLQRMPPSSTFWLSTQSPAI